MAILQKVSISPQMRLDVPDARAIEAFTQNDWKYFLQGVISSKSQIVSGLEVTNYQNIFTVPGVKLQCNNVALIHPEATTQFGGFYVSSGTEPDYSVILNPNTTNFVEIDLTGVGGARDVRAFWDPGANGGKGGEYTDTVDTVINLQLNIKVNVSGFSTGAIPLYKIVTNADGVVTRFTDCRPLLYRLGSGGTSPDPNHEFAFRNEPDMAHARLETAVTATSATPGNAPFKGGDKNLRSMKEWMDVVMTQIKTGFALPYWYMKPNSPSTAGAYQNVAMTLLSGGAWKHLGLASPVTASTSTTLKVQPTSGTHTFVTTASTFQIGSSTYSYGAYNATSGTFSGVSPSASGTPSGTLVTQGARGHLALTGGSTIVRLGQANSTLLAFADVDLTATPALFIILSTDGATVAYSMGDDGVSAIKPKTISATTVNSITVATGGNYKTGSGTLMVRGQSFSYSSYASATGVFLGVSPDPSGLLQSGDLAYQAGGAGLGYYHTSASADVPGTQTGSSDGVERTYWLAYYDGANTIIIRDSELIPGEQIAVGDSTSKQIIEYIGSTGEADNFPVYGVGSIADGTDLTAALRAAFHIIEKPIFDEIVTDTSGTGWASGATIFLPANSRANNAPGQYTVGSGELQVYENGILLRAGYDYLENSSISIQLSRDAYLGTYFRFRISSIGGAGAAAGGGSAGIDLQGVYGNGSTIVTTVGNPVVIDGPSGGKLMHVKGDMAVDGVLDPLGVQLAPVASNPLAAGQIGLWVDSAAKHLMYSRPDGTILPIGQIVETIGGQSQNFARTKVNNSTATIPAGSPVYIASDGSIGLAGADSENTATFFGVTSSSIAPGASGSVIYTGVVSGILAGLGLTTGTYLWLSSTPGGMQTTAPTEAGAHLRIIGIVDGDDLILQQQHNGQIGS